jgi:hypothetical protein
LGAFFGEFLFCKTYDESDVQGRLSCNHWTQMYDGSVAASFLWLPMLNDDIFVLWWVPLNSLAPFSLERGVFGFLRDLSYLLGEH